ncbi:MAG: glycosyltransferase family 2 protein [Clostridia bacterium]|nr:glycosyltransferase family 2 protein [Clostridia bacterium]
MDVVLIPAYEPDEKLIGLVDGLKAEGFFVLVVNDGSGRQYDRIFDAVSSEAEVICLAQNSGKGAALKFGMNYIKTNLTDCTHFITCDADGQHKVEDVVRVREKLHSGETFVLTVRRHRHGIPFRSWFGNALSRFVYTVLASHYLSDNQSGLRGFAVENIDWLLKVKKDNYDYEMNMLYYANKQGIKISTLLIEAIYIDNNQSSHFKPVSDTVKIYKCLFSSAMGSFIPFFAVQILLLIFSITVGYDYLFLTVPGLGGIYCLLNIGINRFIIFKNVCYRDYLSTLIYSVMYYFVYTFGCLLFKFAAPAVPLIVAFNITFVEFIPLRYYLHKFMYLAMKTKS